MKNCPWCDAPEIPVNTDTGRNPRWGCGSYKHDPEPTQSADCRVNELEAACDRLREVMMCPPDQTLEDWAKTLGEFWLAHAGDRDEVGRLREALEKIAATIWFDTGFGTKAPIMKRQQAEMCIIAQQALAPPDKPAEAQK